MARSNVNVTKKGGNLGRRNPSEDKIFGYIDNGVAVADKLVLGTIYPLKQLKDAEDLGITAAYDDTNSLKLHHTLERWFEKDPDTEIRLMVVAQSVTLAQMVDKTLSYGKKLLRDSEGAIKYLSVGRSPVVGYTPTLAEGLDQDVINAITKAKELLDDEFVQFRYLGGIAIEGRSFNGTAAAAKDLRTMTSEGISVVIASDLDFAASKAIHNGYAALGDFMGNVSKAAVSQEPGELTSDFNLKNEARGWFLKPGLSSNLSIKSYSDVDLTTLHDKGYVFGETVADYSGVYINAFHCCVELASDFAYGTDHRTIAKAMRLVRRSILPKVKSRLKVDTDTGFILPEIRTYLENLAASSLDVMERDEDISGGAQAYIDPETNVLADGGFDIQLTFVPTSIGREITIGVGFSNPNKN